MNIFRKRNKNNERIYLDHAATTPLDREVYQVMRNVYEKDYFNPGAMYKEAVGSQAVLATARQQVANLFSVPAREIVFTHGGTESINMALQGVIYAWHDNHAEAEFVPEVVVSILEHAAVRETLEVLAKRGLIKVKTLPVNSDGVVSVDMLKELLSVRTILVSIMYANNEIGTIQPIREIAKILRNHRKYRTENDYPYFHTDAIQASQYLDMHAARMGADLISISASKIYGPKSVGALWMRGGIAWSPLLHGGKQESARRPGTVDVAIVAGMGQAVEKVLRVRESEIARLRDLQSYFFQGIDNLSAQSDRSVITNGHRGSEKRLPHNVHIGVSGVSGERLVLELDARGIAASAVAACVEHGTASHVTLAMYGHSDPRAHYGTVRLTMGRQTTSRQIDIVLATLKDIFNKLSAEDRLLADAPINK